MEHLHHFGLRQDPFQNEPDLRFYFDSVSHAEPQRRVERGLRQFKGLSILTGEAGTGKTLLSRRILEALEEELFDAHLMVMLPGASDALSVLSRFSRMLGVEDAADDRPALLAQIYEKLAIVREDGRHSVLILDDAHLLDHEAMAEMGGLLNLEYEDRRLLSLLIVGLPQVDVILGHEPSMGQRIDVRALLRPLDHRNSIAYMLHRITTVGGNAEILTEDAISALFKYGRGRPRLLNTLADNALFEAYLGGRQQILGEDVERAANDLGIGLEPGSTYTDLHSGRDSGGDFSESMSDMAGPGSSAASMLADIGPPGVELDAVPLAQGTGFDPIDELQGLEPDDSAMDLGDLIDEAPHQQATELIGFPSADDPGLDASMGAMNVRVSSTAQAVLEQVDHELGSSLPSFEGRNSATPVDAGATRIAFAEEEEIVTAPPRHIATAQPAANAGGGDDFDDLFVELIED